MAAAVETVDAEVGAEGEDALQASLLGQSRDKLVRIQGVDAAALEKALGAPSI